MSVLLDDGIYSRGSVQVRYISGGITSESTQLTSTIVPYRPTNVAFSTIVDALVNEVNYNITGIGDIGSTIQLIEVDDMNDIVRATTTVGIHGDFVINVDLVFTVYVRPFYLIMTRGNLASRTYIELLPSPVATLTRDSDNHVGIRLNDYTNAEYSTNGGRSWTIITAPILLPDGIYRSGNILVRRRLGILVGPNRRLDTNIITPYEARVICVEGSSPYTIQGVGVEGAIVEIISGSDVVNSTTIDNPYNIFSIAINLPSGSVISIRMRHRSIPILSGTISLTLP